MLTTIRQKAAQSTKSLAEGVSTATTLAKTATAYATDKARSMSKEDMKVTAADFTEGLLKGEISKNPSAACQAGRMVGTTLPLIGYAAVCRDVAYHTHRMAKGEKGASMQAGAALLSIVPWKPLRYAGTALRGMIVAMDGANQFKSLAEKMQPEKAPEASSSENKAS
jgi:hypothetical protein